MAKRVEGKIAFCTAAGAGIGRATAIALAREGAKVIATDLNEALLAGLKEEGVAEVRQARRARHGGGAGDGQAVRPRRRAVQRRGLRASRHGARLHGGRLGFLLRPERQVDAPHDQAFLPGMLAKGKGSIINIASTVGANKTAPNRYVYSATKAAVVGLSPVGGHGLHRQGHPLQLHLPRHHRDAVAG